MDNKQTKKQRESSPCPGCGGSGQTSFFGGESRFLLTWEDCPDCHGTGIVLEQSDKEKPNSTIEQNKGK